MKEGRTTRSLGSRACCEVLANLFTFVFFKILFYLKGRIKQTIKTTPSRPCARPLKAATEVLVVGQERRDFLLRGRLSKWRACWKLSKVAREVNREGDNAKL